MAHWALYGDARGLLVDVEGGRKDENFPINLDGGWIIGKDCVCLI